MARLTAGAVLDRAGRWRWKVRAANGKNTAVSGEDFASKSNAKRAFEAHRRAMQFTEAVDWAPPGIKGTKR